MHDICSTVVKSTDMANVVSGIKDEVRDLLHLPYLHDSALMYHVRQRYFGNYIYTNIGPILLALNPFTYDIPHYKAERMGGYIREGADRLGWRPRSRAVQGCPECPVEEGGGRGLWRVLEGRLRESCAEGLESGAEGYARDCGGLCTRGGVPGRAGQPRSPLRPTRPCIEGCARRGRGAQGEVSRVVANAVTSGWRTELQ